MAQNNNGRALRVLLIDSRPERRRLMRQILLGAGLTLGGVDEADDEAMALAGLDPDDERLVVLEMLPLDEGLTAIAELRRRAPRLRIVACSFRLDRESRQRAMDAGADACLDKPIRTADVRTLVGDLYPDGLPWADAESGDGPPGTDEPTQLASWVTSGPEELPSPAGIAGGGPAGLAGP
jgi:CheY-like chemotaxis protein